MDGQYTYCNYRVKNNHPAPPSETPTSLNLNESTIWANSVICPNDNPGQNGIGNTQLDGSNNSGFQIIRNFTFGGVVWAEGVTARGVGGICRHKNNDLNRNNTIEPSTKYGIDTSNIWNESEPCP